ncbi:trypsin-like peptidase domain-containing protein [Streptomyces sp. DSM 110735]|uniref:effector-associated domain 2-containing protein n=1 Tax=Streptomyces sp. DSM 110735 TaxID=2775031 RepID=UPI0018F4BC02|nr:trypsin-like peptidase domain-containing protein [Streptomyces sp. DSM 110735]MBJ7906266.1 trypsin-like peptidase domain-containing protein [Streptomyces sp. DSM 110735]
MASGRVRVLSPRGGVRGAGILVRADTVLTCAHVVTSVLGQGPGDGTAPEGSVLVDVPGLPGGTPVGASVLPNAWFPGPLAGGSGGDLAVLRLSGAPPGGTAAARLGACGEPERREVRLYGHPAGAPDGLWARARLVGRGGPHHDWIQLEGTGVGGPRIGHGFSGAGVWDAAGRRVVGMVTAAYTDQQARAAWMLPLEAAARAWPELGGALAEAEPETSPVPQPPSDRDQFALADALLDVPPIEDDGGAALRGLLPPRIRRAVRTHARPRLQLFFVVQACAEHPDGRRALVDAVRLLDDESRAARSALDLLERLWPAPAPAGGPRPPAPGGASS